MKYIIYLMALMFTCGCAANKENLAANHGAKANRVVAETNLPFQVLSMDVVQVYAPAKSELHKWYVEKLGLAPNKWGSEAFQQFDLPAGSAFAVNYSEHEEQLKKQRFVVSFKVSDIKAAVKHMSQSGVKFLNPAQPIYESDWGFRASFKDPQGNLLQIIEAK